jgi:putative cell wall-binding protein
MATLVAVLATLMVAVIPPPAAHAAAPRPSPTVWDVAPATGQVVSAGQVRLAGTATASSGIASVEVTLDGATVPHTITSRSATTARVEAAVEAAPGEHVVVVRFTANDGTPAQRGWRFSASGVARARLDGPDRYATAATIAASGRGGQEAPAAVLARGDDHADALAGVPLAYHLDAPLLLTESGRLTPTTAESLRRLVQPGGTVHLLGGGAAISTGVADAVRGLGFAVARHAGGTRHETAAAVASQLPDVTSAVVASGHSFPDALAAAAPAAIAGRPILLTDQDQLPEATRQVVDGLEQVTIVGGGAVVGTEVAQQVRQVGTSVERIAGGDRYETAARIVDDAGLDTTRMSLASGEVFPDALVGALDAARRGSALVLTRRDRLPLATGDALRRHGVTALRVYGGTAAISPGVAAEARAAAVDAGPDVLSEEPAPSSVITSLDQLTLNLGGPVQLEHTSISVLFDGKELPSRVGTGDFDDTVVLSLGALTVDPVVGRDYEVRVVGAIKGEDGWTHVDRTWTYRKTSTSSGDVGPGVRALQDRLMELGYWLGTPDGEFGSLTVQAVMAFQKYEGLPITGTADATTRDRLAVATRPKPADPGGYHIEIDKRRQIIMFAENGTTRWTMNVSTGSEIPYEEEGGSGTAITPTGNFDVCYERDYLRESSLGTLWRPKYFQCGRGIAVHGATSVPGYPASHGCVRVTYAAMNFIWSRDLMPMGARVWVYGSIPG